MEITTETDPLAGLKTLADAMGEVVERLKRGEPCPYENAFRRGYHQAAHTAYAAVARGADAEVIGLWVDQVQLWREDRTEEFCPPGIIRVESPELKGESK